jgi:hypothetical protein
LNPRKGVKVVFRDAFFHNLRIPRDSPSLPDLTNSPWPTGVNMDRRGFLASSAGGSALSLLLSSFAEDLGLGSSAMAGNKMPIWPTATFVEITAASTDDARRARVIEILKASNPMAYARLEDTPTVYHRIGLKKKLEKTFGSGVKKYQLWGLYTTSTTTDPATMVLTFGIHWRQAALTKARVKLMGVWP